MLLPKREQEKQREQRTCSGMQYNVNHVVVVVVVFVVVVVAVHVVLTSPKGIFIHSQVISWWLLLSSTSLNLFRITSLVTRFRLSTNPYVCVYVCMHVCVHGFVCIFTFENKSEKML